MAVIFVFALTPLPDSVLFIPLGLMRYPVRKVFAAALLGKIAMSLIITYFGGFLGQTLTDNWIFTVVTVVLLVIVVVAMFKIDWEKLIDKYPQLFSGKGLVK